MYYSLVSTQIPKAGILRDPGIRRVHRTEHWIVVMVLFSSHAVAVKRHQNLLWTKLVYRCDLLKKHILHSFKQQQKKNPPVLLHTLFFSFLFTTARRTSYKSQGSSLLPVRSEKLVLTRYLNIFKVHTVENFWTNSIRRRCSSTCNGITIKSTARKLGEMRSDIWSSDKNTINLSKLSGTLTHISTAWDVLTLCIAKDFLKIWTCWEKKIQLVKSIEVHGMKFHH